MNADKKRKSKPRRKLTISAAVVGFVIVFIGGGLLLRSYGATQASKTVKIAVDMPTSFLDPVNSMLLALDEAGGKAGDINVELVMTTDEYYKLEDESPTMAALEHLTQVETIADDAIVGYFGPIAGFLARDITPLLNEAGIAQMSSTITWPGLTKVGFAPGEPVIYYPTGKRTFFRVSSSDDIQGMAAAKWVKQRGLQTAYVVDSGDLYTIGLIGIFERIAKNLGLEIMAHETIEYTSELAGEGEVRPEEFEEIEALAARVVEAQPDVLYCSDWNLIYAVKRLNPELVIVGGDYLTFSDFSEEDEDPDLAEGLYASYVTVPPDQIPAAATFVKNYQTAYGQEPHPSAVGAYDAMNVFLYAIEHAEKPTREGVLEEITNLGEFSGALGDWHFDDQGDISIKTIALMQVQDGKWVFVEAIE